MKTKVVEPGYAGGAGLVTTSMTTMSQDDALLQDHPPPGNDEEHQPLNTTTTTTTTTTTNTTTTTAEVGSSLWGAIFNFTNCVVGAGALGLGGALASSGGILGVVTILVCGLLTKLSLDRVIQMSLLLAEQEQQQQTSTTTTPKRVISYEELGERMLGTAARRVITAAKFFYSFGCMVAYLVVIQDNLAPAISNLIYKSDDSDTPPPPLEDTSSWHDLIQTWMEDNEHVTWTVSTAVVLPLCLLRDMTPLSSLSVVSILSMLSIIAIVIYLYWENPHDEIRRNHHQQEQEERFLQPLPPPPPPPLPPHDAVSILDQDWLEVHLWGYLQCLGTFVFTFVSQHTVHLTFGSLQPRYRTLHHWKVVSTATITLSATISIVVAVMVYITFGTATQSDIFNLYPAMPVIDYAKVLLCLTMLLTFPLPFFTCRELVVVTLLSLPAVAPVAASVTSSSTTTTTSTSASAAAPLSSELDCHHQYHPHASLDHDDAPESPQDVRRKTIQEGKDSSLLTQESNASTVTSSTTITTTTTIVTTSTTTTCSVASSSVSCPHATGVEATPISSDDEVPVLATAPPPEDDLREPLLPPTPPPATAETASTTTSSSSSLMVRLRKHLLLPAAATGGGAQDGLEDGQLQGPYHVLLTILLWFLVTSLAIAAPNLGDVLDLVGCATGTLIAFVMPALLSIRFLQVQQDAGAIEHWIIATVLLVVGVGVGLVGTTLSVAQLMQDAME